MTTLKFDSPKGEITKDSPVTVAIIFILSGVVSVVDWLFLYLDPTLLLESHGQLIQSLKDMEQIPLLGIFIENMFYHPILFLILGVLFLLFGVGLLVYNHMTK